MSQLSVVNMEKLTSNEQVMHIPNKIAKIHFIDFQDLDRYKAFQVSLMTLYRVPLISIEALYNFARTSLKDAKFLVDLPINYSSKSLKGFLKARHLQNHGAKKQSNGYAENIRNQPDHSLRLNCQETMTKRKKALACRICCID